MIGHAQEAAERRPEVRPRPGRTVGITRLTRLALALSRRVAGTDAVGRFSLFGREIGHVWGSPLRGFLERLLGRLLDCTLGRVRR